MTLEEYKSLSEHDRMMAAVNALAQVAMSPTVTAFSSDTALKPSKLDTNALIERMTGSGSYKVAKVSNGIQKAASARTSSFAGGRPVHGGRSKRPAKKK